MKIARKFWRGFCGIRYGDLVLKSSLQLSNCNQFVKFELFLNFFHKNPFQKPIFTSEYHLWYSLPLPNLLKSTRSFAIAGLVKWMAIYDHYLCGGKRWRFQPSSKDLPLLGSGWLALCAIYRQWKRCRVFPRLLCKRRHRGSMQLVQCHLPGRC